MSQYEILLADTSVTVQKVVALCFDKTRYYLTVVTKKDEILKKIAEKSPALVLLSDQIEGVQVASFPMEIEVILGRRKPLPPFVLLSATEHVNLKHYAAVLKKPFMPQALLEVVDELVMNSSYSEVPVGHQGSRTESGSYVTPMQFHEKQNEFNANFPDENVLTQETMQSFEERSGNQKDHEETLWPEEGIAMKNQSPVMDSSQSLAYKAALQNEVDKKLSDENLSELVDRTLREILPPIVERLVQSRLDDLLKGAPQVKE